MLVLSRRVDETIEIPDVGISLQVVSIGGNRVKVGIQAPDNIRVLRGELAVSDVRKLNTRSRTSVLSREELHDLKNRLNAVGLALQLYQRQRADGLHDDADTTLQRLFDQFEFLEGAVSHSQRHDGPRALLVEDDSNERELLAGLLRMNGYSVETACDGLEALAYLESHTAPDVVLLDMRMPRCDGPATIERIRKNPNTAALRVFAVSATRPSELGVSTGAGGVDGWFAKPLHPESVARQIRRTVQKATA